MNTLDNIAKLAAERAVDLVAANHVFTIRHETPLDFLGKYALAVPAAAVNELYMFGQSPDFQTSLNAQADFLANMCAAHRDFACNVASPAVQAAVEKAREMIAAIQADPTAGFTIDTLDKSVLLESPDFMDYVARYYNGTSHTDLTTHYPLYTHEQILGILQANSAIDQAALKDLLASMPEGQLDVIWQSVFLSRTRFSPTVRVMPHQELLTDYQVGGTSAIVIFLLAATLYSNITDDVGMNLADAQAALLEMAATAANYVRRAQEYITESRAAGFLVSEYNLVSKRIKVDAKLYKAWQDEGGRVEVLLGAAISDMAPRTVEALKGLSEQLIAEWENYLKARQGEADSQFQMGVMTVLRQVFLDSIETGNLIEVEAEQLAMPGAREKAVAIFTTQMDAVSGAELRKDWVEAFWRAFAKARFHYSNAYEILSDIHYEVNERQATPDDAATTAMANAVCRFVASMMVCRPMV